MSSPFIGEIQLYGFNFNPRGWAFCNGATLPIAQNTALFSLLGTTYGGNGQTTFQLPNLSSRAACQAGQGPGLSIRDLGETFGVNSVTLSSTEIPMHNHGVNAFSQTATGSGTGAPGNGYGLSFLASSTTSKTFINTPLNTQFAPNMIAPSQGGGLPHENMQPYLGLNFCIALQGIFPSRN